MTRTAKILASVAIIIATFVMGSHWGHVMAVSKIRIVNAYQPNKYQEVITLDIDGDIEHFSYWLCD